MIAPTSSSITTILAPTICASCGNSYNAAMTVLMDDDRSFCMECYHASEEVLPDMHDLSFEEDPVYQFGGDYEEGGEDRYLDASYEDRFDLGGDY